MGSLKDIVAVVLGLGSLGAGVYFFYLFVTAKGSDTAGSHYMWYAIGCGVVFFICALIYFLGHVNKEEEIHITQ